MEITTYILSSLIGLLCFVPLIDAEHWTIRGQEYVKVLYFFIAILLVAFMMLFIDSSHKRNVFILLNLVSIIYCLNKFIPLTRFFPVHVPSAKTINQSRQLKIIVFNVWQKNQQYKEVEEFLQKEKADIVFLLETNKRWENNLQSAIQTYPHVIKSIREDTYGLILLSNLKVKEKKINHVVTKEIPSMKLEIDFHGKNLLVYGLHPKPPILGESVYSSKKDEEFKKIALEIAANEDKNAYVAIGDFNEVSWGRSFKKLWKKANLRDPRRGRFFKPTFPSYLPMRIPLDHVLCSSDFEFVNFEVKDNMGSDHFPIVVTLQLK